MSGALPQTVVQDFCQPDFHCRADFRHFRECELLREAGGDIGRKADSGSQRSRRTSFDPGSDDKQAGVMNRHALD